MQYQTYHHSNAHAIQRKHFVLVEAILIDDEKLTIDSESFDENPTLNHYPTCHVLIL